MWCFFVTFFGKMTLAEKISQMQYDAPAIERLSIPAYNWWNECLHGVGRAGCATVFPQAIGMAASFDTQLMYKVATASVVFFDTVPNDGNIPDGYDTQMGEMGALPKIIIEILYLQTFIHTLYISVVANQ